MVPIAQVAPVAPVAGPMNLFERSPEKPPQILSVNTMLRSRLSTVASAFIFVGLLLPGLSACQQAPASSLPVMVIHKTPTCGCCANWVEHVKAAGFQVEVHDHDNLSDIKRVNGVAPELQSCHTALVGGYVVEGHVPADQIIRLVTEKPDVKGIAVPGMPIGSPGMEQGGTVQPYNVVAFDGEGNVALYKHVGS